MLKTAALGTASDRGAAVVRIAIGVGVGMLLAGWVATAQGAIAVLGWLAASAGILSLWSP